MKKIDRLILTAFLGPFFLTFFVVIFILLSQFMLRYFDEIVGKDLGFAVIAELIFYFSIFMTQNAFPLAVLLSSLMTFGNLGEHFELTAIKSAGISLVRALLPIFVFSLVLSTLAYFSNNYIVPRANLKAFSLLYDVKQKKPSMELKQGTFYNGIDGYSIKVNEKLEDGRSLKDLIIYDHTKGGGNRNVILADSGQMYNILDNRYLILELFNGKSYSEQVAKRKRGTVPGKSPEPFVRNEFEEGKLVFNLSSFNLKRTKEELFAGNKLMKNTHQLVVDIDSMENEREEMIVTIQDNCVQFFTYHLEDLVSFYRSRTAERNRRLSILTEMKERAKLEQAALINRTDTTDSIHARSVPPDTTEILEIEEVRKLEPLPRSKAARSEKLLELMQKRKIETDSIRNSALVSNKKALPKPKLNSKLNVEKIAGASALIKKPVKEVDTFEESIAKIDSFFNVPMNHKAALTKSLTQARNVKNHMSVQQNKLDRLISETNKFKHERYRKLSYAATILIMFLIGAPLGAIIKRGGLGFPVLISMAFFILFYVISMIGEKYTRQDLMDPFIASWMANVILLPIGLFFMRQAKNDARLFDTDFYSVIILKVKKQWESLWSKMKHHK